MQDRPASRARSTFAIAAFAALFFGPPSIHVRTVTPATKDAPAGAVLMIDGKHHTSLGNFDIIGRAESFQNGRRVTKPLTLTRISTGLFAVSRQWENGSPWVLVFSAEQGDDGVHGIAEALVKVDARGTIVDIQHRNPAIVNNKVVVPKAVGESDILTALQSLQR